MRQTNVVVIPNCNEISEFHTFDKLVAAINQARRVSRDFVLKKKERDDGGKDWVWVVALFCLCNKVQDAAVEEGTNIVLYITATSPLKSVYPSL